MSTPVLTAAERRVLRWLVAYTSAGLGRLIFPALQWEHPHVYRALTALRERGLVEMDLEYANIEDDDEEVWYPTPEGRAFVEGLP